MQTNDDTRNGLALVSRRYDFRYVQLGKPNAPSLGKRKEFVTRYSKLEYLLTGEASASTPSSDNTAWGQYKNHRLPTGAGAYTVNTIGAVPLVNQDNSLNGGTRLPGMLMSLTRIPNLINAAGTASPSTVNAMIPFLDSGGNFVWKNSESSLGNSGGTLDLFGIQPDGTYSDNYSYVYTNNRSGASSDYFPGRYGILKNVNLKLELWGQKTRPTKFHIVICQLDQDVNPSMIADATTITGRSTTFTNATNACKFWTNEFKPYTHHPWAATYTAQNVGMKVLFSDTVYIEAKSTQDNDTTPQCRMKNYTFAFNRRCHFDWDQDNNTSVTEADVNRFNRENYINQNRADVNPNARIYFFIKAENFKKTAPAIASTSTDDNIPSFSMKTSWTWELPT